MALVKVAEADDLKDGEGRVVAAAGKTIALFKQEGAFYAIDNTCPHREGPLGEGMLQGMVVTCPWHGWQYDIATGVSPVVPTVKVSTYKVHVQGNDVLVDV